MEWLEAGIPQECRHCASEECYNCDMAGKRWVLSREDELKVRRKLLVRGIERMKRKIAEIDAQLEHRKK